MDYTKPATHRCYYCKARCVAVQSCMVNHWCWTFCWKHTYAGDSLRCVCRSTIDGVLVPTPGCDSNSTCTIDKQNRTLYVSGLCYKEVLVLREGGGKETVTVTQACLSLNVHGLVINPELCATSERTRERTRDAVCCGGSDYCNDHLLTGTLGEEQPSAGTPDTRAATNHNSTSNQGN